MSLYNPVTLPWSAKEDDCLKVLWEAGWTSKSISLQLPNRSPDAVVGRANRLSLPSRPSPIPTKGVDPRCIISERKQCEIDKGVREARRQVGRLVPLIDSEWDKEAGRG